jgi:hypothetical protein
MISLRHGVLTPYLTSRRDRQPIRMEAQRTNATAALAQLRAETATPHTAAVPANSVQQKTRHISGQRPNGPARYQIRQRSPATSSRLADADRLGTSSRNRTVARLLHPHPTRQDGPSPAALAGLQCSQYRHLMA